jgi:xylulose-5-phosphate/fructose-6-phosphate phosphoketolase
VTRSVFARDARRTDLDVLRRYRRAANYLTVAQIYLRANVLLREPLRAEHIKPRLLGHWGTAPGINLVYAHLDRLIAERDTEVLLITGPGHGAAANLANLYLEGSLAEVYPDMTFGDEGLLRFVHAFSWPGGFASHLTPALPGTIHEGGELGYALATAFGAAFDDPELLVACIVGDGEAETGATAAAWHATKFLDPATSGAVLPVLHLNGYKISEPTLFGTMTDDELVELFTGYGWGPRVVAGSDDRVDDALAATLDAALDEIRDIQQRARAGDRVSAPRWPMLVLRTPKGWTGPREVDGFPVEGSFRSHQVPAEHARTDPAHLAIVESWLRSYRPDELFTADGRPQADILGFVPRGSKRMGVNARANGGSSRRPLDLPELASAAVRVTARGAVDDSALEQVGRYLAGVMRRSEPRRDFRIVCPDELLSNKLGAVLDVTDRAFVWPIGPNDEHLAPGGRVVEVLSEHLCEGFLEGYLKTGRHGIFPCYEAFVVIVDSMVAQYAKYLKVHREQPWRAPLSSLTFLLTSEGWRQDHNGYSHQGPGFINSLLTKKGSTLRIYLPPDANTLVSTVDHCLRSTDYINLIVATKQPMPQWLSMDEAVAQCAAGASIWPWASTEQGAAPDVVLAAAGNVPTRETLAAADLLRRDLPDLRVRVVNVIDLMVLSSLRHHPHGLAGSAFTDLFTADRPVVFAFHGYPSAIHQLVYDRPAAERFHVRGYIEEGTTTTPFDMLVRNGMSRYQLAIESIRRAAPAGAGSEALISRYEERLADHRAYIGREGEDPESVSGWRWSA